ncbi:uncharacterized protein HKW66_Vig0153430 [Vigna angularis]|uniref:RRM domain-containing protein n=2 Tax=Phaseolus angularis TaxID=3914 RepID=A0A8T0JNK9_PHAAN|nr:nucleolar protein 12 [Vigna angularis]KAG2376503.1 uncharacterized protein HKW66_Vig0153430 [Vigna angularis]BAT99622.1 hypothetical protein VIGAN_10110900 [Vigna angularis var. angularis]
MGKKKPKDPQQTPQTDNVSSPSSIFNKLFGNAPEQGTATAASLFSDENPFRRKPVPLSDTTNQAHIPNNGNAENRDAGDEKKRKKNKEKSSALDSVSVTEVSEKSEKRKRGSDEGREGGLDLGAEAVGKRKRKRDEVEREWEEKRYGLMEEVQKEGIENKTVGNKRKSLDDPADTMVAKEGFDDENKLLRTVFVGNLPLKVKKKILLKEFKKFGEVESVRIRSVPIQDTKKPRKGAILAKKINDAADSVHAYIVFKTEQSAQASLSHNMSLVEGNHIRVDRACPPRKKHKGESVPLYDNKRTVFVGNLPFDVKDEELYQLFCGISNLESSVEAVRVVRDAHLNVGKGIAYVLFKTKEAAKFVVKKRNLKLRDRELRLSHAKADATPSKRSNPSSTQAPTPSKRPNTSSTQAPGTPSKKFSVASRSPSSSVNRSNRKANASYQGLRATKSDVHKKTQGGEKPKQRLTKRPSVAARKAKANLHKEKSGAPKQAGIKRKLDSRTPDSAMRNKKVKKNR